MSTSYIETQAAGTLEIVREKRVNLSVLYGRGTNDISVVYTPVFELYWIRL